MAYSLVDHEEATSLTSDRERSGMDCDPTYCVDLIVEEREVDSERRYLKIRAR